MGHRTLSVRPMTHSDILPVALVHRRAFAGSMGASIGMTYAKRLALRFLCFRGALARVVCMENDPVGYVFGAPAVLVPSLSRGLLPHLGWGLATHPRVLLHRDLLPQLPGRMALLLCGNDPFRLPAHLDERVVFNLVGIGVDPGAQGNGCGKMLLEAFARQVWRRGFAHIQLDVRRDNAAAWRLYQTQGWVAEQYSDRHARFRLHKRSQGEQKP